MTSNCTKIILSPEHSLMPEEKKAMNRDNTNVKKAVCILLYMPMYRALLHCRISETIYMFIHLYIYMYNIIYIILYMYIYKC